MAKAKPAQVTEAVTQDTPEVTQPVTPEVSSLDTIAQDSVGDKYKREDGVQVTVLPGGTVREDY